MLKVYKFGKRVQAMEKRGQVTMFIIVAIIIVVAAILLYVFVPRSGPEVVDPTANPQAFIRACVEETLLTNINTLGRQGGSMQPDFSYSYDDAQLAYLCYAEAYYELCVVQQPLLYSHFRNELESSISAKSAECFNQLQTNLEAEGYQVSLNRDGGYDIQLQPKRVMVNYHYSLTMSRDTERTVIDSFTVVANNNIYELLGIAQSIVSYETQLGDAETTVYMNYYPNIKVEKHKQTDGTTVYVVSDRDSSNVFQFASRSLAWPPGYGLSE